MAQIEYTNPSSLGQPLGQYSQITRVKAASEYVFIAGQVGMTKDGRIGESFDEQCSIVFDNIHAALKSCDADWSNIVQFTTYLVHSQDIAHFMTYRLRAFPGFFKTPSYPPNTLLMIDRLVQEPLLIEVQAIAAL